MSTPPSPPPPPSTRFGPYKQALQALAARTGAPLPSLVFSFAVVHEVTALVPLVAIFVGARQLGVGERVVQAVASAAAEGEGEGEDSLVKRKTREWMEEGERWAGRVGRRYGVFGFEKGAGNLKGAADEEGFARGSTRLHLAGDIANAVVAYGLNKALLPARIGLSLWLTPSFSRRVVEPIRLSIASAFKRKAT